MTPRSIDIGRAFSFMFEEDDWITKFFIAVVMLFLGFLILPGLIVQGYVIEIIRRVGRDRAPVLPAWDDWGKYLGEGFMAVVAQFIYALPLLIPFCCIYAIVIAVASDESGDVAGGVVLLMCCFMIVAFLAAIPLALVYYAGLVRYADTGRFNAFFQFGQLWATVRDNLNLYGLGFLVIVGSSIIGSFVPFLGNAWAYLVSGHVLGQLLRFQGGESSPDITFESDLGLS